DGNAWRVIGLRSSFNEQRVRVYFRSRDQESDRMKSLKELKTLTSKVKSAVEAALNDHGGLLRLAPCWVPRSFLQPGKRLKLNPDDLYAFGLNRGGIDERWFGSTTPAANENRTPDEGLSYVVHNGQRFTLADAVAELGGQIIGERIWNQNKKW